MTTVNEDTAGGSRRQEMYRKYCDTDDQLIERREKLMDFFTPNGNKTEELVELLEIERELTKREE